MDFEIYKNDMPYPSKPRIICPKCQTSFHKNDNFCSHCGENVAIFYINSMKDYDNDRNSYNKRNNELKEMFWNDLFKENDIELGQYIIVPVFKIREYAWEEGHSEGLYAVASIFEEIISLGD